MTAETATPTVETEAPTQHEEKIIPYIGNGSYTPNMLASWSSIEKRLLARGHKQAEIDFIYATAVCPKGHEGRLNESTAAEKFFPGVSTITAKLRAQKVYKDFVQQLFSGQIVETCQAAWDEARKPKKSESQRTYRHKTIEEKAEIAARKELKTAFRLGKNVGKAGRLKPEIKEEEERYLEKFLPTAIKKIIADLQG